MRGEGPVKDQIVNIPTPKTPDIAALKPETREILRYILEETEAKNPVTTSKLMLKFNRTEQSLDHQIKILRYNGLVDSPRKMVDSDRKRVKSDGFEL